VANQVITKQLEVVTSMCELLPSKINHLNQVVEDKQKRDKVNRKLQELKKGKKFDLKSIHEEDEKT